MFKGKNRRIIKFVTVTIGVVLLLVTGVSFLIAERVSSKSTYYSDFAYADQFEEITIESDYPLFGYYQDNNAEVTFVFVHGLRYDLSQNGKLGYYLEEFGDEVNYLTFDLRAHGKSGGNRQTFGREERYDVNRAIDYALSRNEDAYIVVVGDGGGATIALQTAGIDDRISGLILENPISDLVSHAEQNIKSFGAVPKIPFRRTIPIAIGIIGGFPPESVDVTSGIDSEAPMLIMAGMHYDIIDYSNSERIYEVIKHNNEENKLVLSETDVIIENETEQYFEHVREFLKIVHPVEH